MKFYEYSQLLEENILANAQGSLIIAVLLIAVIIFDWIIDKTLLANESTDGHKRRKKMMIGAAIIIAIEVALTVKRCWPVTADIKNESYVCVHGEYYMFNYNYRNDRDGDIYVTLDNGETVGMYLPKYLTRFKVPSIDEERFPSGKHMGTVWYAENSHYILEFIPDEPTDGD